MFSKIFNAARAIGKAAKKVRSGIMLGIQGKDGLKNGIKMMLAPIIKSVKSFLLIIILVIVVISAIIEGVKVIGDYIGQIMAGGGDVVSYFDNLSEEEKALLKEQSGIIDPNKIKLYYEVENSGIVGSVNVKRRIDNNGRKSTEPMVLDLTAVSSQFKTPWQFIAALDVVTENSFDMKNKELIEKAKTSLMPIFEWGYEEYTKDVTEFEKSWNRKYVDGVLVSDGKGSAKESYYTTFTPLPIFKTVVTPFKTYTNNITTDVVTEDGDWSGEVETISNEYDVEVYTGDFEDDLSQPIYGEGNELKGYEQKEITKTEHHTEVVVVQKRTKVVEDIATNANERITPSRLFAFIDDMKLSKQDLGFVIELINSMPSNSDLAFTLTQIVEGKYEYANDNFEFGDFSGNIVGTSHIPLFIQWDERWGNEPYSGENIARAGCGVTSLAMVVSGLGGNYAPYDLNGDKILDPREAAVFSKKNGHVVDGVGTAWSLFGDFASRTGLKCTQLPVSRYNDVWNALSRGVPVIASVGPGHFTTSGHFIVLTGIEGGKIKVNDPNSKQKSDKLWDFTSVIVSESRQFWIMENPNASSGGVDTAGKSKTEFEATAYYAYDNAMEGGFGTASGKSLRNTTPEVRYIAVDRRVIPLNSKVYIEFPGEIRYVRLHNGKMMDLNGVWLAADTGGAIKNNKVDIYMGSSEFIVNGRMYYEDLANHFGRRKVYIYK